MHSTSAASSALVPSKHELQPQQLLFCQHAYFEFAPGAYLTIKASS